jgi:hypothetical protein
VIGDPNADGLAPGIVWRDVMKSAALEHALLVIESYASEIRCLELPRGSEFDVVKHQARVTIGTSERAPTLGETGFCQGRIYREAVETIKRIALRERLSV